MMEKYFFFDFDGICSKDYANTIEGKFMKTINAGSKEAIEILHANNYKAICITSDSSNVGQKIIKDWCSHVKTDDLIFCKANDKMNVISDYLNLGDEVIYVGDDIYDEILLNTVDRGYTTELASHLFKDSSLMSILYSDKPLLEAVIKETNFINSFTAETLYNILKIRALSISELIGTAFSVERQTYLIAGISKSNDIILLWVGNEYSKSDIKKQLSKLSERRITSVKYKLYVPVKVHYAFQPELCDFLIKNKNFEVIQYEPEKTYI